MIYFFNSHLSISKKLKYIVLCVFLVVFSKNTAQICPQQNNVPTNTVLFGQNKTYQASQTVNVAQSTNTFTILNGGKVTFKAGTDITFYDGFDALQGSEVSTSLETCTVHPLTPNDLYFSLQWGHSNTASISSFTGVQNIGVEGMDAKILDAWTITQGSPNVIVAIIDSGLDIGHPDIDTSRIINQRSFENYDNNPMLINANVNDVLGHGTLVTGIIAATTDNNIGTAGIDKFCKIMPIKITNDLTQLAPAIDYAVTNGAKVINMSFGRRNENANTPDEYPQQVIIAINNALRNNVTIIAAAGNDGLGEVDYPSAYPGVISVGAANPCGLRKVPLSLFERLPFSPGLGNCDRDYRGETSFVGHYETGWGSNYGLELDLLAPGVLLPTTDLRGHLGYSVGDLPGFYSSSPDGNYILNSFGTSFASPFVCGVVSLMLSVNPNLTPSSVKHILTQSATTTPDNNKLVNAYAAVVMAQNYLNSSENLPVDPFPIDPYPIETMRTASNNDKVSFEIYPNPAKDYFSIAYDSKTFKKVRIVDVLGTLKFEKELDSSNQINIESVSFASGVYVIQLIDKNEGVSSKKLIKN